MSENSFVINDDNNIDNNKQIITDFYTAIIYLNQFKKTQSNGGYIHISYFMPSGTIRPNATYISNTETRRYKCINMYIFKKSHKIIMDSSFDGELVIELIPTTNSLDKLFLVYLLKNSRIGNPTELDEMIKTSISPPVHFDVMNLTLNDIIKNNKKRIMYMSGNDRVIIDTTPISVAEMDFSGYIEISQQLFSLYPVNKEYTIIKPSNQEGFTENFVEGEMTTEISNAMASMECVPIDVNDDNPMDDAVIGFVKGNANKQTAIMMVIIFCVLFFVSIAISPIIFKNMVEKKVTTQVGITTAAVFIPMVFLVIAIVMMTNKIDLQKISEQYGDEIANNIKKFSDQQTIIGIFLIVFVLISYYTISNDRSVRSKSGSIGYDIDLKSMNKSSEVIACITSVLFANDSSYHRFNVMSFVVGFWIVFLLLIKYIKQPNSNEKVVPEPARKKWEKNILILGFMVLLIDCVITFSIT